MRDTSASKSMKTLRWFNRNLFLPYVRIATVVAAFLAVKPSLAGCIHSNSNDFSFPIELAQIPS
jgi:hypothetical protein